MAIKLPEVNCPDRKKLYHVTHKVTEIMVIGIEVASSRPDHLPPLSIAKTDSINGKIYSDTLHARYSRAPPTSSNEVGRPSTNNNNNNNGYF